MTRALIIDAEERAAINRVRAAASAKPVPVREIVGRVRGDPALAAYMDQMAAQTIALPVGFVVGFSIETGHPCGPVRHLSVSVEGRGKAPSPTAVGMIAEEFGFVGGLEACQVWAEAADLSAIAVNVAQPLAIQAVHDAGSIGHAQRETRLHG